MKRKTYGPSLTTPKSSTTRGDLRVLHAPTSSLMNLFSTICDNGKKCNQSEHTEKPGSGKKRSMNSALPFWQRIWSPCWYLELCVPHRRSLPSHILRGYTPGLLCIQSLSVGFSEGKTNTLVSMFKLWTKAEEQKPRNRTYIIVKNDSLIDDRIRCWQLIFLFSYVPLNIFEKWRRVAWVPLTDAAPEASKGQGVISLTAEAVWVAVLPIGVKSGKGAGGDADLLPPVQCRAVGTCAVDLWSIERRPTILLFWAFNAATAQSTEVTSTSQRWLHLRVKGRTWLMRPNMTWN